MIYIEKYKSGNQSFFVVKDNYSDYVRFDNPRRSLASPVEFEIFSDEDGFFQRKLAPSILDRW